MQAGGTPAVGAHARVRPRRSRAGDAGACGRGYGGCMLLDSDHELPAGTGSAPVPDASLGDLLERAAWPAATGLEITGFAARARDHALFSELDTSAKLVVFTQHHVFAVWDYMALLHSVRQGLGAGEVHWTPPIDSRSSRLIYEILLEEEAGPSLAGTPLSHFEMYLQAMRALGGSLDGIADIQVDGEEHGPATSELVERHARGDARAAEAARRALEARVALWDGILEAL